MKAVLAGFVKALIGAYPRWESPPHSPLETTPQRIYFANHASHLDTVALWSALPPLLRHRTRPVAALDYWNKTVLHRYVAKDILNVVMIDRHRSTDEDPLTPVHAALNNKDSLIIFPEGTRNAQDQMLEFKSGLYHLAKAHPRVELVPVYLDNARRSLPKGQFLPIPLTCLVKFGAPMQLLDETKEDFLTRARAAVLNLSEDV